MHRDVSSSFRVLVLPALAMNLDHSGYLRSCTMYFAMTHSCQIRVADFGLFCDFMKTAVKIVDSAKIQLSPAGAAIYGARKPFARCELTTNAVSTDEPVEFCVLNLALLVRVLQTVKEIHSGDFSDLALSLEGEKLCFKSKKFKSKIQTQKESIVEKWVSTKVQTVLKPVFEFKTTKELIRRVKSHQFVFQDMAAIRVYLTVDSEMENGSVFATLGNKATRLDNEITLKFGLATFGQLSTPLVLDSDRLNLLDAVPAEEQTVKLMDANVLVSEVSTTSKNGSFFTSKLYLSILKP